MSAGSDWVAGRTPPPPWRTNGAARTVFDNPWVRVEEQAAVAPTGAPALYGALRFKNLAAGVLPIHDDGTVTLVGQHRFPLANFSWEMPEGGVPEGEDPLAGIKRELAEEAGLQAATWVEALRLELSNSISDEQGVCWLAWGLTPAPADPDPTEAFLLARPRFRDLLDAIGAGEVRDSLTVATAYRAYHMAREGLLPGELARAMLD
jgi:8-oxo-dGTP pyrophosphatase MutT (NUDIX family)